MQVGDIAFAALGLSNMFNGGGAVQSVTLLSGAGSSTGIAHPASPNATVAVRGAGTLLMYASRQPARVRVCGLPLRFEWWGSTSGALTVEVPPTLDLTATVCVEW
jgi:hypothetical protein